MAESDGANSVGQSLERLKVLVSSVNQDLTAFLQERLHPAKFVVRSGKTGWALAETVWNERPNIVVVDRAGPHASRAELALAELAHVFPGLRIVAISAHGDEGEAHVLEQDALLWVSPSIGPHLIGAIEAIAVGIHADQASLSPPRATEKGIRQ